MTIGPANFRHLGRDTVRMKTDHLPNIDSTAFVGRHLRIKLNKKATRKPPYALKTQSQSKKSGDCVLHRREALRVSDGDIDRLQRSDASRALGEVGIIRKLDALVGLQAHPQQPPDNSSQPGLDQ